MPLIYDNVQKKNKKKNGDITKYVTLPFYQYKVDKTPNVYLPLANQKNGESMDMKVKINLWHIGLK